MASVPIDLSAFKPDTGDDIEADPLKNMMTSVEVWSGSAIDPEALLQKGAATGNSLLWDGAKWTPGNPAAVAELDRATITAPVTGITATTEGTAVAVITGNSVTYTATEHKIEFFAPAIQVNSATVLFTFVFLRDSTVLGQVPVFVATANQNTLPIKIELFDTPTAGAHVYSVKAFVASNTGLVKAGLGGTGALLKAWLRVTR